MFENDRLMKEVAEDLAKEMLNNIPSDEELDNMDLPEGFYERVAHKLNIDTDKTTTKKKLYKARFKVYWIAAIIATMLLVGSLNAGALNLGFIVDTIQKIAGNNEIRSVDKKTMSKDELQLLYDNLFKSKKDIKFTPSVFAYIPDSIEYKTFNVNNDGRELAIFYEKNDTEVQFRQRYTTGQNTLGASLDNSNTEHREVKINKKDVVLYIVKHDDNDNYAVRWSDNDYCYYTVIGSGLAFDELLDMIKSVTTL